MLDSVSTILLSVKTTNDFLNTDIFRRLFDASLAASFGQPSHLLRDGLRIIHAILEEFSSPGSVSAVPRDILHRMGCFLMRAARWAGDGAAVVAANDDIEAVQQLILRMIARLPASAVLSSGDGGELTEKSGRSAAGWETEELTVMQRCLAAEFDAEGITGVEVRDFLAYIGGGQDADDLIGVTCGELEELEANYAAVSAASLRSNWQSWTTAGYVVYNKLRSPVGKAQETLGAVDQACRRLAALSGNGMYRSRVLYYSLRMHSCGNLVELDPIELD